MKKGITVVSLAVTILLLAVITSMVLYTNSDVLKTANKTKFALEILDLQTKVDNYFMEYGVYPVASEIDFNVAKLGEEERAQIEGEQIVDGIIKVYALNLKKLGIKNTLYGNNKDNTDIYVVSKRTGKVYYIKGISYNHVRYYTVTSDLYDGINDKNMINDYKEVRKSDITFRVNRLSLGKDAVWLDVIVPYEATDVAITATNDVVVSLPYTEGSYRKYSVNASHNVANYDVKVVYTLNEVANTVEYSVNNVDNEGPTITINKTKKEGYVLVNVKVVDSGCEVVKIKYDKGPLTKSYFAKYGKNVVNNLIECYETSIYTIYAEDTLGNSTIYAEEIVVE